MWPEHPLAVEEQECVGDGGFQQLTLDADLFGDGATQTANLTDEELSKEYENEGQALRMFDPRLLAKLMRPGWLPLLLVDLSVVGYCD